VRKNRHLAAVGSRRLAAAIILGLGTFGPNPAAADEDGVSFWLPGLFGSLAAAPLQPGFSQTSIYYHTSVSAGSDVARAQEIRIGRLPAASASDVDAESRVAADEALVIPSYTFAAPVLGGQATVGLMGIYGRSSTSEDATLNTASLSGPFALAGSQSYSASDSVTGFGDLVPQSSLRWNAGVHNYIIYATGDIPVGAYDPSRLSNIGIGHGALDGGLGYTYYDVRSGHEFSAVADLTSNFINPHTQYRNGVDFHLDWSAAQFLTKQFQIGVVGYVYNQLTCDSGAGDQVGCYESRVASVGAQLGYVIPLGDVQGSLNLRGYGEFAASNRPAGWNTWVTFVLSPAPSAMPTTRMHTR
jgi:hypothetical protein